MLLVMVKKVLICIWKHVTVKGNPQNWALTLCQIMPSTLLSLRPSMFRHRFRNVYEG